MNANKPDIQKRFRRTFGIIAFVLVCSIFYIAGTKNTEPYKEIIASGVITEKYQTPYDCGSKNRYTCSAYYLTIDRSAHRVKEDVYLRNTIGKYITLEQTVKPKSTFIQEVATALVFVIIIILLLAVLGLCGMFIHWGLFYSNGMRFRTFVRNVFL